jgi:hypothetical protein
MKKKKKKSHSKHVLIIMISSGIFDYGNCEFLETSVW